MLNPKTLSVTVAGKEITFETGKIARQANGAVVVRSGETTVFCSACRAKEASKDLDFLPLRVDYQEKFSSAGKTLGGFIKREGRPSEKEILTCRLIDRPLRPMFEDGYFTETQILSYVWSYDGENQPDTLAICAASAALTISDIPLIEPVAAVKVGFLNDQFVINPTTEEMEASSLDLILAGTKESILMIEGFCDFFTEEQVLEAIYKGHKAIREICLALAKWREEIGQPKKRDLLDPLKPEVLKAVEDIVLAGIETALKIPAKEARNESLASIKENMLKQIFPEGEEAQFNKRDVLLAYKKISSKAMRKQVLETGSRVDGRSLEQIRQIEVETDLLPRSHGSALFTRGETQAVAVCTLGSENMAQRYESLDKDSTRQFYLQYSFPPFSVGEVGRVGGAGRREIGHGKLAERALTAILPTHEDFPYVIRLESNITESNGSSSMASVCGGCLAMMNAGVPIKKPISGIAMGLILEKDKYSILSDILGLEDALGDMDFKITGDEEGITAFQMDIKVSGITPEIMKAALLQAKGGRRHILGEMLKACPKTNDQLSKYAPKIASLQIPASKIGMVIGPGGKQIKAIIEETGCEMNINDAGVVSIASQDQDMIDLALSIVTGIVAEAELGKTYHGRVVSIMPFGAFIEILPGKEGLCHISELDHARVNEVTDVIQQGDKFDVQVIRVDENSGKISLSRKALLPKPEGFEERPPRERRPARDDAPRRPRRDDSPRQPRRDDAPRSMGILPPPPLS